MCVCVFVPVVKIGRVGGSRSSGGDNSLFEGMGEKTSSGEFDFVLNVLTQDRGATYPNVTSPDGCFDWTMWQIEV